MCKTRLCTHTRVRRICQGLMPRKQTVAASFIAAKAKTSSENWEWSKCRTRCWSPWRCPPVLPAPGPQVCWLQRCCFSEHTVSGGNNTGREKISRLSSQHRSISIPSPLSRVCLSLLLHVCLYVLLLLHHLFMCPCSGFLFSTSVTFILKT